MAGARHQGESRRARGYRAVIWPAYTGTVSWVLTLLGIVLLIVLHELGHFTVAKAVGMRVERFSLFFPPTLFRVRRGETEYAIGAIPAGGYVKITGMSPEEIEGLDDPEVIKRAYCNQAPWKRIVVILAGPGVNILIAFLLFWAVLFTGSLNGAAALGNLDPSVHTLRSTTAVQAIEPGKPADGVLKAGDRIVRVDGRPATQEAAVQRISAHRCAGTPSDGCRSATPVTLTVLRAGRDVNLSVYPSYSGKERRMLIGFEFGRPSVESFGVLGAAGAAGAADVAHHHRHADRLRACAHELKGTQGRSTASSASPKSATKPSSPAPATRSCSSASYR